MEMSRLDGELGKPALVCICSERQWLLWRPIFENSEITKLVNENFIFWAQPSDHGAEGKQGLAAINQHNNNTGIVAIVCSRAVGEIKVLLEVTGPQSVADLKRILNEVLRKFKEQRNELMALQRERELKRQQDLEYEASQKADKEKEQRKRNSKACQCSQEPKEVPVEEEKTDEPPPKRLKSSELKRLIVVLPDGKRHQMDVASNITLMKLYEQVNNLLPEGSEPIILSYQLEGGLWRKLPKHTMTVDEFGVVENVILRASNSSESNTAS